MRRFKPYPLKIAGIYLYLAHLAICYGITELHRAGFDYYELEDLLKELDKFDKRRQDLDWMYFDRCMKKGIQYDEKVFFPSREMKNGRISFDLDEDKHFNLPFELRGEADD